MLKCIALRLSEDVGVGKNDATKAYELCGSYAVAKEYLKLIHQAVARYKMVHGEKVHFDMMDYLQLAKENVNKQTEKKLVKFIERDVNGFGGESAEVWVMIQCNLDVSLATTLLTEALEEIANGCIPAEEWDTDSAVKMAYEHVFGKYADFEILRPDFEIEFGERV